MSTADGNPLLLLDRVEKGRVALLLSDQIWLWSRGHDGGGPQAELLRRIAHWLMKEPALDEEALRATISKDELHVERRTLSDAAPGNVTITSPSGTVSTAPLKAGQPGSSAAAAPAGEPGVYQVSDGTHTAYAAASVANPPRDHRPAGDGGHAAAGRAGLGRERQVHRRRVAGAAADRTGTPGVRSQLDRPAAPARLRRDRDRRRSAAAALGGAALAAGPGHRGMASGGRRVTALQGGCRCGHIRYEVEGTPFHMNAMPLPRLPPGDGRAGRGLVLAAAGPVALACRPAKIVHVESRHHPQLLPGVRDAADLSGPGAGRSRHHDMQPGRSGAIAAARPLGYREPALMAASRRPPAPFR